MDLLRFENTFLPLNWEKEDIGGLLAIPVYVRLTSLLGVVQWLDAFHLSLVADLSGLLLAVLDAVVLLSFLETSPHLELAGLLRLGMVDLLLSWKEEAIGELLHLELIDLLWLEAVVLFQSVAQWLDVALAADLSGLLLAVLDVAVRLGFLGTSLHLELVGLLRLETGDLLLSWK